MRAVKVSVCLVALSFVALGAACSSDPSTPTPPTTAADRGPTVVAVDGDPNGLFWDAASDTLYIADDNGNRVLKWTDAVGIALVKDLPAAPPEGAGLGQLVLTADGTIVVTRFGYGTTGDVVSISKDGEPQVVPNLDKERRRVGLTLTGDGKMFDAWFVRLSTGARVGAIGSLTLAGEEPEVLTGLKKPIGVLAVGDDLFVSDQDLGQILKAKVADPKQYSVFATVDTPDLIGAGPDGSIFTGSAGGNLYKIAASGEAAVFKTGFQQVRGVAYDAKNRRVFVVDHDGNEADGVTHSIQILPVD